jgi:hypothetical protein
MSVAAVGARDRLRRLMAATAADSSRWFYRPVRPQAVPQSWARGQTVTADCSKAVQFLCRWAGGIPDPMRSNWGPYGNSQTLWSLMQPLETRGQLQPGDVVVFGPDGRDHAAMVYAADADPLLWSFGHQGAPNLYRLSADRRVTAFRSLGLPAPPPSPAERLRAESGFYSWVAWRLGEGQWRAFGPQDAAVRPSVPAKVPAEWWGRLVAFLAARRTGNPPTG